MSSTPSDATVTTHSPKVRTNMDTPPVEITIRQTAACTRQCKGWPETLAARAIQRTLDDLDLTHRIVYDLPPVGGPGDDRPIDGEGTTGFPDETQDGVGRRDVYKAWRWRLNNGHVRTTAKDANLLLTAHAGGGVSTLRGWASVAPGGTLDQEYDLREWAGQGDPDHCLFGILHELAHCLGFGDGGGDNHEPHWGEAYNDHDNEVYVRTPTASGGRANVAGEVSPEPEYEARRDILRYHASARAQIAQHLKPVTFTDDVGQDIVEHATVVR